MDDELKNAPEMKVPAGVKSVFTMSCTEKSIKLYDKVWTKLTILQLRHIFFTDARTFIFLTLFRTSIQSSFMPI